MRARDNEGRRKYGTPLTVANGRDQLIDAYQEQLDLIVYLRAAIIEKESDRKELLRIWNNLKTCREALTEIARIAGSDYGYDDWIKRIATKALECS